MYLYDLKVNRKYRGQHIGKLLIQKANEIAVQNGYCGLYTQGQDNNPKVPHLAYPHVSVGNKITGNYKALYYSDGSKIIELFFNESDSLAFLLYLCGGSGTMYPEVQKTFSETADMLFDCIRNCVQITDLTDVNLEQMALPIRINGQEVGTFDAIYMTDRETNQFICISLSEQDSEELYRQYVMTSTLQFRGFTCILKFVKNNGNRDYRIQREVIK